MKILDRYILKSFAITFASVFVILFFIFILQTVWLFIAELAGKDLDIVLVLKFLLFAMPRIVPLVLPLSILLASIMTFGNFSENYEFAAMKSSGISLQRVMRSLIVFIFFLSMASFLFANNVIPYAEYKFINFRKDIAQMKPAMAITEGQFSDVGDYNIKVDKKSGDNGNFLTGVTIHKKSANFDGAKNVIRAKTGELVSNDKSNILKLVLNDGYYYEDLTPKNYQEKNKIPFAKSSFKKYVINLDLSKLNDTGDDSKITNTNTMLKLSELTYTIDSLDTNYNKDITSFTDNISQRIGVRNNSTIETTSAKTSPIKSNILSGYDLSKQLEILNIASNNVSSNLYTIDATKTEMDNKLKVINSHWVAVYDKFVIAFACFLMFFLGAPLGAIIRKGGLGLPIVFAILIFIIYHFINTFGKKLAQENGIPPFFGSWMSSLLLAPFAIMLTYRATNDIGMINMDVILTPIQKLFKKIFPSQK